MRYYEIIGARSKVMRIMSLLKYAWRKNVKIEDFVISVVNDKFIKITRFIKITLNLMILKSFA